MISTTVTDLTNHKGFIYLKIPAISTRPGLSLTLPVLTITNINFLLTKSVPNQEKSLRELTESSPKGRKTDLLSNSLKYFSENVWRSVWRICMFILGLEGLNLV